MPDLLMDLSMAPGAVIALTGKHLKNLIQHSVRCLQVLKLKMKNPVVNSIT